MHTVPIDYVWQAILESERHDDILARENTGPIETPTNRSVPPLPDQAVALNGPAPAIEVVLIAPSLQAASDAAQPSVNPTRQDDR